MNPPDRGRLRSRQHLSDRIGVMYLGKLVEVGAAQDVFDVPLYPYTQALSFGPGELPRNGTSPTPGTKRHFVYAQCETSRLSFC